MQAVKAFLLVVLFAGGPACRRAEAPVEVKPGGKLHEFTPDVFHNAFAATTVPVLRVSSGDSIHLTTIDAAGTNERVCDARLQEIRRPAPSISRVPSLVTRSQCTSIGCA